MTRSAESRRSALPEESRRGGAVAVLLLPEESRRSGGAKGAKDHLRQGARAVPAVENATGRVRPEESRRGGGAKGAEDQLRQGARAVPEVENATGRVRPDESRRSGGAKGAEDQLRQGARAVPAVENATYVVQTGPAVHPSAAGPRSRPRARFEAQCADRNQPPRPSRLRTFAIHLRHTCERDRVLDRGARAGAPIEKILRALRTSKPSRFVREHGHRRMTSRLLHEHEHEHEHRATSSRFLRDHTPRRVLDRGPRPGAPPKMILRALRTSKPSRFLRQHEHRASRFLREHEHRASRLPSRLRDGARG
jgi:hypothetical protein